MYFNQYKYRSYFISLPLWLQQDVEFAQTYRAMQASRHVTFTQELKTLATGGYLLAIPDEDLAPLLAALLTTNRLWISEATLDGLIADEKLAVNTYLNRMAGLLNFIASEKGKADVRKFLKKLK
jgi:hypothetical protein